VRFAIKTSPQHTTWADMLAVWKEADDIDLFESAWTFDHFYPIVGDSSGPCLEGWITLSALAQATRRLRVGVLVTGNVYRHPAVLANMAATLDVVSGGRLELGLGAGWNEEETTAYGIDLPPLKERFDRFDEACDVVIGLLTNETTDYEGRYYTLRNARCEPKPVQRPHPPICIGGGGEKRTLRTTARVASHWNVPGGGIDVFTRKRDVLHAHCADLGRDPAEIVTSTHLRVAPGGSIGDLVDEAAAFAEAGMDLGVVTLAPPHDPGVLGPLAEALRPLAG
jgi:F420-dependent oxidoreductase-like protein